MTKDVISDTAIVSAIAGLSIGQYNDILACIGLALAIPLALFRLYVGWQQAREWHYKRRKGD